jgi:2-keto-4-pentenoate hydratase/2-oxohepta-3-ene-1,7-dioic acid hydratase in catechol pathway
MKFTTYLRGGEARLALVDGNEFIDLNDADAKTPSDLRTALKAGVDLQAAGSAALERKARRQPLAGVKLAPPVPEPGKIVCLGLNYYDHAKEGGREKPDYPWFFFRAASSLVAHGESAWAPKVSTKFDYEAELAVVIGRRAKDVRVDDALDVVSGYLAMNDVSDREAQSKDGQWSRAKSYDTFGPCGPAFVPASEIPDPQNLAITCDLNGQRMQDSNTGNMIFGVRELIAFITARITLEEGDVISTGTPDGVGAFRPEPVFLKPGDVMTVTVEGIGSLTNPVVRAGE